MHARSARPCTARRARPCNAALSAVNTCRVTTFYRYIEDSDVHVVDCSGRVDLETGLSRLRALARELDVRPIRGSQRKLLIDFRHTVFESEDVHRQLSIVTRRDFGLDAGNAAIRVAILDNRRSGSMADNERWFLDESDALEWLRQG